MTVSDSVEKQNLSIIGRGICLFLCLLLVFPAPLLADVIITDATTGTNGSTTYPGNANPLGQSEALTVQNGGSITTNTEDTPAIEGSSMARAAIPLLSRPEDRLKPPWIGTGFNPLLAYWFMAMTKILM